MLRWDLTITTGLSAKNLVIYMLATFLALRMVIGRSSIVAAGQMQAAFLVQIGYAIFTWLIAALVIKYQDYDFIDSGIKLKGGLIDYYIFFLVFLFGVQTAEDGDEGHQVDAARRALREPRRRSSMPPASSISATRSASTAARRARIGESNQYAAYIILFLPGHGRGRGRLARIPAAVLARRRADRARWRW